MELRRSGTPATPNGKIFPQSSPHQACLGHPHASPVHIVLEVGVMHLLPHRQVCDTSSKQGPVRETKYGQLKCER